MVYLGTKVKDKLQIKLEEGLKDVLPAGEFVVAVFRASRVMPLVEAIVMTNQRFMSIYPSGIGGKHGFPHQIVADDIKHVEIESKKFDGRLQKLFIIRQSGAREFIADVLTPDHDAILSVFDKMSGSPALLNINERKDTEVLSEKQLESLKARIEKHEKNKYQSICPRCGSDNLQVIQETRTRGVSTVGSTAGCCCLGPIGLLCGLPGAGSSSTKTQRMCLNCGKKF